MNVINKKRNGKVANANQMPILKCRIDKILLFKSSKFNIAKSRTSLYINVTHMILCFDR